MSATSTEEENNSMTGDEIHSLGNRKVQDDGNTAASSSVPITSEEVARQV